MYTNKSDTPETDAWADCIEVHDENGQPYRIRLRRKPTPKGTLPITPATNIPFPCWCRGKTTLRWRWVKAWAFQDHPSEAYDFYSTNGPDDRPEDVGAETLASANPTTPATGGGSFAEGSPVASPTLEQLAEKAARELNGAFNLYAWDWDDSGKEAKAIILRHLSPEWERMVREREQWRMSSVCRELRAENERLRQDSNNVQAVNADLVAANKRLTKERDEAISHLKEMRALSRHAESRICLEFAEECDAADAFLGEQPAKQTRENELESLRARVRELGEDKARLDWLEGDSDDSFQDRYEAFRDAWYEGAKTIRAAIDAARAQTTKETP